MKISHRLTALSAAGATALALIGVVGLVGLSNVRDQFEILNSRAAPMKAASLQAAQSAELTASHLASMSSANSEAEVEKYDSLARASISSLSKHAQILAQLDPNNSPDVKPYAESVARVKALVSQQLGSINSFEQAAISAREALRESEAVVDELANSVNLSSAQAGLVASDAKRTLDQAFAHQLAASDMVSLIKDLEIIAIETGSDTSESRLASLRERFSTTLDLLKRVEIDSSSPESILKAKAALPGLNKAFADQQTGLFRLRESQSSDSRSRTGPYRKASRALLIDLRAVADSLASLKRDLKTKVVLAKQSILEARPLDSGSASLARLTRDLLVGTKRLQIEFEALMRAEVRDTVELAREAANNRLQTLSTLATDLLKVLDSIGEESTAQSVAKVLSSFRSVETSVETVATGKATLLIARQGLRDQILALERVVVRDREMGEQRVALVTAELALGN